MTGSERTHLVRSNDLGEMAELAEGAPLLREYGVYSSIEGSNPSLSAIFSFLHNYLFLDTAKSALEPSIYISGSTGARSAPEQRHVVALARRARA